MVLGQWLKLGAAMLPLPGLLRRVLLVARMLLQYRSLPQLWSRIHWVSTAFLKDGKSDPRPMVIFHVMVIHVNEGEGMKSVWKGNIGSCFSQIHTGELGLPNPTVSPSPATPGNYCVKKENFSDLS